MDDFDNTLFSHIQKSIAKNNLQIYGEIESQTYNTSYNIANIPIEKKDNFCKNAFSKIGKEIETKFMPPMVRWMSKNKDIIVFEKPPEIKKITIIPEPKYKIESMSQLEIDQCSFTVDLFIPWQVYLIVLNSNKTPSVVAAFLRPNQLESLTDPVFCFPLPNVYTDGRICTPVIASIAEIEAESVSHLVQNAYQMFWSSSFNYDLTISCSRGFVNNFVKNKKQTNKFKLSRHETTKFLELWDSNITCMEDINFIPISKDDLSTENEYDIEDFHTSFTEISLASTITTLTKNYIGSISEPVLVNTLYNNFTF